MKDVLNINKTNVVYSFLCLICYVFVKDMLSAFRSSKTSLEKAKKGFETEGK